MTSRRPAQALDPPLAVAWHSSPSAEDVSGPPLFDGRRILVAAGSTIAALDPADGRVLWHADTGSGTTNLTVARAACLASGLTTRGSVLTCLDGSGTVLWTQPKWAIAQDSLGRDGDDFVVLGRREDDQAQMCRVLGWDDGRARLSFECPASSAPERIGSGFVYSVRSSDPQTAGLFLYRLDSRTHVRLLPDSHSIRSKAGEALIDDMVVVDTTEDARTPGELIAVNVRTAREAWRAAGGYNMTLAVDRGQLAAVESLGRRNCSLVLRDLTTGRPLWKSAPLDGSAAQPLIAADWAAVSIDGKRLHIFDRANGHLQQTLAQTSLVPDGFCCTPHGLVAVDGVDVICLRHGSK